MNCSLATVSNRTNGFDFAELFIVYTYLKQTCPPESDIFFPGTRLLTDAVCHVITDMGNSWWTDWTPYPIADIWERIVTWKLPLSQLVAQFPRPPLGLSIETATIAHLLGDPVDSIASMLLTYAICQSRADLAKKICKRSGIPASDPEFERTWKALAMIIISYDDCGLSDEVEKFCMRYCELAKDTSIGIDTRNLHEETAYALAADRSTKALPVVFAECIFIGGWIVALLKAMSSEPNPTNWVNIEAHSVAFSTLYLWVTSAVVLSCIIGSSQTEGAIPRLLQGLEYQRADMSGYRARRPSALDRQEMGWCCTGMQRAMHGGLYSMRLTKWRAVPTKSGVGTSTLSCYSLIGIGSVGMSFMIASVLSYMVSPRGPSCRHGPEALMFIFWLLSFAIEYILERWLRRGLFWTVFWKDVFFGLSNIAIVMVTQWGIMNRCSCWDMWGLTGLHLPQIPEEIPGLMHFIRYEAPWIVFTAILVQLLFGAAVCWWYWDAVKVYIQRDDGASNASWRRTKRTPRIIEAEAEGQEFDELKKPEVTRIEDVSSVA